MVHELEQILPALPPEAGLHVTQEGQVLLPRVRLGEEVLEGLAQGEQDLLVVYWLVPALDRSFKPRPNTSNDTEPLWSCSCSEAFVLI